MSAVVSSEQRVLLVDEAKRVARMGLMPMTQGNLSLRDPATGLILITPHDYFFEKMTPEDVVVVDLQAKVVEGPREPSGETAIHCAVYEKHREVNGIVHSEPIWTNSFGVVHKPIAPVFVMLGLAVGGAVPVMPFEPSGSREFAVRMLEIMGDRKAVIWASHGLLTVGKSLREAVRCTVMVETGAQIYHLALQIGQPVEVSQQFIDEFLGKSE